MRILYHHRTMADGAEGIHIREIVRALRNLGHEVHVEALAGDPTLPAAPTRTSRLKLVRQLIPDAAYEVAEIGYNVVGTRRLLTAVSRFRPDVIYDRYNAYSTAALNTARRRGLPLLLEVNAPVAYERTVYEHLQLKLGGLARRYEKRIFTGADRIFAVSTPLKRHLVETVGISPEKIVVLPNGADPDVFVPGRGREDIRERYGWQSAFVIGFVGILRPWHGVDLLLDAFVQVRTQNPDTHLLIVGDGPLQAELEARARNLGLAGAVTFTGRLRHDDVVRHIAAMDVAVSPHATFYASPMKILEYMAMGVPVVAPAMENIRDIVDEATGVLFEANRSDALSASLQRLMTEDSFRQQLGRSARQRICERFNWRTNAQIVVDHARALSHPNAHRGAANGMSDD